MSLDFEDILVLKESLPPEIFDQIARLIHAKSLNTATAIIKEFLQKFDSDCPFDCLLAAMFAQMFTKFRNEMTKAYDDTENKVNGKICVEIMSKVLREMSEQLKHSVITSDRSDQSTHTSSNSIN